MEYLLAFVLGVLGGIARELMASETNKTYFIRSVIIGGICGLLYKFSGMPNHGATVMAGYTMSHFTGHAYEKGKEKFG